MVAAAVLSAVTAGIPPGLLALAGSPIPKRLPGWHEIVSALSRPDDGTLLLGFLTYLAWVLWAIWTLLVLVELTAQLRGRRPPHIPGLGGPQQLVALLVTTIGATLIGTTASVGRVSALPVPPQSLAASTALPHATPSSGDVGDVANRGGATAGPARQGGAPGWGTPPSDLVDQAGRLSFHATPTGQVSRPDKQQIVVRFAFNSAELSGSATDTLTQTARDIQRDADPARPVVIVGHTDSRGPADYNQRLSVRRAQSVRQALGHLAGHGFHFQVSGRGERDPVAKETRTDGSDDPAGRARNRRVEITYTLRQITQPAPTKRSTPRPSASTSPQVPPVPPTARGKTPGPVPSASGGGVGGTNAPTAPPRTSSKVSPTAPSAPDHHQPGQVVRLPTGALVGLGLASAISIAVAATRLHRRRRRTPQPDRLTVAEPEPAPPPAARALRKAHLEAHTAASGHPVPSDTQLLEDAFVTHEPTDLRIGIRAGSPASVPIAGLNVGLTGPGATDAARAIATELLTCARHARLDLVLTEQAAATLFNLTGDELTQLRELVPDLTLTPDLDAALRHLEIEILHRSRMMAEEEIADITALRTAAPGEPLPTIVLIAEIDESERFATTLLATLQVAQRHGIGGLLLGPWPAGTTCHIDTDGQVTDTGGPEASAWADLQLFHLSPGEGAELLQVIRTARGADDPPSPEPATQPDDEPPADGEHPARAPAPLQPPHLKEADQTRPVHLRVLGPVRVETAGGPIGTGLRSISRDLMALLALHPDGITREQGVDALWPERDLASGSQMFHTAVNSIRQALRKATGMREPMFVTHADGRYRLDAHLIDVDLWHFLRALDQAAHANSDTDRIPALHQLADLYVGDLAEDLSYEWAEQERERIRRTATDALVRLARILQDDHPDDALTALEQAFNHDPVSEPLARDLMHLQAELGHPDAARRTHQLLRHHLDDLDIDPSPETDRVLTEILSQRKQPRRL